MILALVLRTTRLGRTRVPLGVAVVSVAPIPIVLGVYWRTATPTTLGWILTGVAGIGMALLQIAVVFAPNLLAWMQPRLVGIATPVAGEPMQPPPGRTMTLGRAPGSSTSATMPGTAPHSGIHPVLLGPLAPPSTTSASARAAPAVPEREEDVRLPASVLFGWVGAVVGPLLLAWALVTLLHWAVEVLPGSISALYVSASHRADHEAFAAERSRRRALAASSGKTVAVTLSGGGYRAAATHAGALSILDAAGIPVSVLSTVSGGSIAGAAYAQGWTPECFAAYLRRRKPGLPDDLLSITAVIGDLVRRDWGSGDVYATHFGRRYFHDHTIAETGPPDLVVNVTDYDTGDPVAIMKGREVSAGRRSPADALPLRTVVAASGAFPVAFQPVSIYGARYVDGGVVENLGVTGLSRYVAATGRAPDVLIVSDVGAEPQRPHQSYKPSPFQVAVQAPDLTSRALHEILYRTYSNGRYDRAADTPPEQPFRVERATLWPGVDAGGEVAVFFLAPTSPAERHRFGASRDRERLAAVAGFRTLQELEPAEVDAAFWAGAALARAYLPDIWRALGKPAGDTPLPPVPAAPTCP